MKSNTRILPADHKGALERDTHSPEAEKRAKPRKSYLSLQSVAIFSQRSCPVCLMVGSSLHIVLTTCIGYFYRSLQLDRQMRVNKKLNEYGEPLLIIRHTKCGVSVHSTHVANWIVLGTPAQQVFTRKLPAIQRTAIVRMWSSSVWLAHHTGNNYGGK